MPIQTVSQAFSNEGIGGFSFRNKIINGAMEIDQRNAGSAVTPTSLTYSLDRWAGAEQTDGSLTIQRSTTAPTGFNNSLLVTITSADTSIGSTQYAVIRQAIEGNNVEDLTWGTASAKPITISFWVRSSLTGTFGGAIQNSAQDRSYAFSYTISSANTFEYKTITIPGDTSGTWLTNEGVGLFLWFSFASGSSYSGTGNTWTGSLLFAPTGATNVLGTNGATWYITGVQLEVGSSATPFERRPYGTELQLCQRYFWRVYGQLLDIAMNNQTAPYSSVTFCTLTNPVTMRTTGTFAHNMTNAKNVTSAPGADQWAWYIQNQGYGSTSSGDIANLNGGGQLYCRIGAYTLSPSAASTAIRMGSNIYIENSAEL